MSIDVIVSILSSLPTGPGVYRMINAAGADIYIGKAKNLQKRVASYSRLNRLNYRLKTMVEQVADLKILTTQTELDALLLEAQLIKRHRPKYNIVLKNGYPLLHLALSTHPFPRLETSIKTSGENWTIGPFLSRASLKIMMDILQKNFLLRSCTDFMFNQRTRPCLQYHMQRCSAPCVGKITAQDYAQQICTAKALLKGKVQNVQTVLNQKMKNCIQNHDYDQAIILRNQLQAISDLKPHQKAAFAGKCDVIAWASLSKKACIHVVSWRDGSTYGCESFFFDINIPAEGPFVLSQFLQQFYIHNAPPQRLILSFLPEDWEDFLMLMRHRFQKTTHCIVPKRGHFFALLQQAEQQAFNAVGLHCQSQSVQKDIMKQGAALFSWEKENNCAEEFWAKEHYRIEIYDNSHWQGECAVAVMVVHSQGHWDKKSYRSWSMDTNDDYLMMDNVMRRRFSDKNLPLPDAIIIDGGKGQLSVVKTALNEMGFHIPLVAIAKTTGHDTIFLADGRTLDLSADHPVLHWIQRLRDEAHRFAIQTHRKKRNKKRAFHTVRDHEQPS